MWTPRGAHRQHRGREKYRGGGTGVNRSERSIAARRFRPIWPAGTVGRHARPADTLVQRRPAAGRNGLPGPLGRPRLPRPGRRDRVKPAPRRARPGDGHRRRGVRPARPAAGDRVTPGPVGPPIQRRLHPVRHARVPRRPAVPARPPDQQFVRVRRAVCRTRLGDDPGAGPATARVGPGAAGRQALAERHGPPKPVPAGRPVGPDLRLRRDRASAGRAADAAPHAGDGRTSVATRGRRGRCHHPGGGRRPSADHRPRGEPAAAVRRDGDLLRRRAARPAVAPGAVLQHRPGRDGRPGVPHVDAERTTGSPPPTWT